LIALTLGLYGLIARYLITRADAIACRLYPEEDTQTAIVGLDKDALLAIALIAIGVLCMIRGLTELPGGIFSVTWYAKYRSPEDLRRSWGGLLSVVLEIGVGFYLVLGKHGIIRAIEYLRSR